jgi:TetR/AcrR family transcriptional repressor of nem operon
MVSRGDARTALLDAGIDVIRRQGLAATSVDDVCRAAGVTKGAFFHHFESKEAYAVAVAEHWRAFADQVFASADYHSLPDPLERVLAYLDFRVQLIGDDPPEEYSCAVGTMVQESFDTHPAIREACAASIFGHAASLEADLSAALEQAANPGSADAAGLARFTQAALQGAFIVGKAGDDPALAREAVSYLRELLVRVLAPAHQEGAVT